MVLECAVENQPLHGPLSFALVPTDSLLAPAILPQLCHDALPVLVLVGAQTLWLVAPILEHLEGAEFVLAVSNCL